MGAHTSHVVRPDIDHTINYGLIFRHCLPTDLPSWAPWPSPQEAPLLLAQIRLSLNAPRMPRSEMSTAPVIIIPNAPLLREVETNNVPYLQADPRNPFEQLTTLHFKGMGMSTIIAFLRCCPNLLDLSITSNDIDDSVHQHLELRCLRSLKILYGSVLPLDDIDAATHTFQSLVSLSCDLQSLSLGICSGTTTQLRRFLCLYFTPFTKIKPEIAIQALHGVGVLPRLKRLEIQDKYRSEGEYYHPLLDMLLWRRQHAALESFELFPGRQVPPAAIMGEFRALGKTGLRLRVTARNWNHSGFVDRVRSIRNGVSFFKSLVFARSSAPVAAAYS
ncbi:hypothetical protein B0H13DRAFT_1963879 [Mycena leptocephala]|nr:hypothetical protein B0H13DRAFT_1963879 [Mycena leptocephala]